MAKKRGKKYEEVAKLVDRENYYTKEEAAKLVKDTARANFDETIELSVKLGVDPRHADELVRGSMTLPNGTGRDVKVLVVTSEDKFDEAKEAGAEYVGGEEMIEKVVNEGWYDFDVVIASNDMMGVIGPAGRYLGPRGLMPTPDAGTLTFEIGKAVEEIKAGKIEYRVNDAALINIGIGKASFTEEAIAENFDALMKELVAARPAAISRNSYIKSVTISATMGPGIKIDPSEYI